MTTDPRSRRHGHRMAAVAGGLPPAIAAAEAEHQLDPVSVRRDPMDAAVRLELAAEDMRAQLARPEAAEDLGPGYPADFPDLPDTPLTAAAFADAVDPDPAPEAIAAEWTAAGLAPDGNPTGEPLWSVQAAQTGNLAAADTPSGPPAEVQTGNLAVSSPEVEPEHCPECHPELHRTRCSAEGCVADQLVADLPDQLPTIGGRVMAWASRHDSRSLEFLVRDRLDHVVPVQDITRPHGPILDQGTVPPLSVHDGSSCTGHMAANLANMLTIAGMGPGGGGVMKSHADALDLYSLAQQLDDWPGQSYPGTSVLAAMKAGQQLGWWDTYVWARGVRDIAQALLQVGGVGIGIPWRSGMVTPGPDGVLDCTGEQVGGHAIALHALARTVAGRPGPWFGALQSYGEDTGDRGVVWFHHRDLAALLAGVGEAAIPLRAAR